uniref:Gag-pol polyprotein n=1 Tax=Solanum tuberosum TaxID=4113 RepID=M1DDV8_SOLTU
MHVADAEHVELVAFQQKSVARIWFDQWKKSRAERAPIVRWVVFESAFMGRFFTHEMREAKYGQTGHFMRAFPKNRQGNGNGGSRAQSSSAALVDRAIPRGATSGTDGGANHLYAITTLQEQEISPDVVTSGLEPKIEEEKFIGFSGQGLGQCAIDAPEGWCARNGVLKFKGWFP